MERKNRSSRKWSPRPAEHSQHLVTLKKKRQEASRMKQNDAIVKLVRCGVVTRWARVFNSTVSKGHQVQTEHSIDMHAIYRDDYIT